MSRRNLFRIVTVLAVPVVVLVAAELVLSAAGYATTYEREDPFLGFRSVTPLFERRASGETIDGPVYATRESKLPWFNRQEFRAEKPDDELRIFTFGGSTTYGRPYDHRTSFSRWLEVLLDASNPDVDHEVVNAGGVSYASYRIVNLMNEVVDYEPDLFVVYTGHNEFLEERTYAEILEESPWVTELRTRLHRSRTYSLVRDLWLSASGGGARGQPAEAGADADDADADEAEAGDAGADGRYEMDDEVTAILDRSFGLDQYRRDPERREAILRHFRYNLGRMVEIARERDIGLVFVVPPVNLKDFSPFKSRVCDGLEGERRARWAELYEYGRQRLAAGDPATALEALGRARELDACHADLRYRTGRALLGLDRHEDAKRELAAAVDADVAPLRATSEIRRTVREVAAERGVPAVDLVRLLEGENRQELGHGILGEERFLDHAHPRIAVHRTLAEELAARLADRGRVEPRTPVERLDRAALYDSVTAGFDSTYHATRDLNLAKVLTWLGKMEEASEFVRSAARGLPDHPEAQYLLGALHQHEGDFAAAEGAYRRAIELEPAFARAHNALGSVYERTGRTEAAIASIRRAVEHDPESDHARFALGNALYAAGRPREAVRAYEEAVRLNPRHSQAWNNLAGVRIAEGDYDAALEALRRTLELAPENVSAHKNLGLVYYNTGRPDEARRMFRRTLELSPGDEFARRWLERLDREAER